MDYFDYKDDALVCESVSLEAIAESVGTPVYVYSQATLQRHVRVLDAAFDKTPHRLCYAVKANSNLTLLKRFVEWGTGFEVVSGGELFRVLEAGASPESVILSGVGKTRDEIRQALDAGVLFLSVESQAELELISEVAVQTGHSARVVFRINPDVDPRTHPYISTGLERNKFGISLSDAASVIQAGSSLPGVSVVGIGCHIGSQITELGPFEEAIAGIADLARDLRRQGIALEYLDVGGGLGISYDAEEPPSLEAYAGTILTATEGLGLTLILEPGRVIAGNAGILLCRVIRKKTHGNKRFVIVDAGMNDLIRPALYASFHRVMPVRPREGKEIVDVVGPICESADFIAQDRELDRLESGDLAAVMTAGAYGFSLASNYNSRPRPAEVLVDGDSFSVVRRRETYEDLIRLEK
jgi:diaminopimelate decarboxylase